MKILLIEDDDNKRKSIVSFLYEVLPQAIILEASSYTTGVDYAMDEYVDFILLDMSIPNFEGKDAFSSGEKLKNGGELILNELLDEQVKFHCIIITQYETFNNESLTTIDNRLSKKCGDMYHGCIKYDTNNDNWKDSLKDKIYNVINSNSR